MTNIEPSDMPNITELSLSDWHARLCVGETRATSKLWETYFARMVLLARKQLRGTGRTVRDEEDVALSAFHSFCVGLQQGRIRLGQGDINLWPLLVTITMNKAVDQIRYANRQKRRIPPPGLDASRSGADALDEIVSRDPSPEMITAASESFARLMEILDRTEDTQIREIATASIEGSSPGEIASTLGCSTRTVQRKLKTIRCLWESESS